ncbi:MAG: hypothetical protein FWD90_02235 [Defluviitaleaceae bacterium]|nr:hypothetical protein [Defluviitaleaceae bacterium]
MKCMYKTVAIIFCITLITLFSSCHRNAQDECHLCAMIDIDNAVLFMFSNDSFPETISYTTDYKIYEFGVEEITATMVLVTDEPDHWISHGYTFSLVKKGTNGWHYYPITDGAMLFPLVEPPHHPFQHTLDTDGLAIINGFLPGTYRLVKNAAIVKSCPEFPERDRETVWAGTIWAEFEVREP